MQHKIIQVRHTSDGQVITCSCGNRSRSEILSAKEIWLRHVDQELKKKGKKIK
jgi:hypothetical protein